MEAVSLRILSLIMSVLMFFFNGLSAMFPGLFPDEPLENNIAIFDAEAFELDETAVISDYVSWLENGNGTDKYDWKFFFTRNIAAIKVELPDPGYSVEVDSVKENGETLEIEYRIVRAEGIYPDVECSRFILVETSKNISLINAKKNTGTPDIPDKPATPDVPEKPAIPHSFAYGIYSSENFKDDFLYNGASETIKNIEKWNEYYIGSDEALDEYDEKYFEENNLIVFYIEVPDDGKTVEIASVMKHTYYNAVQVNFRVKNGESDYTKGYWAVVIETGKDITFSTFNETGIKGESVLLDAEMFREDYLPSKEDGAYEIVSSYSEFNELTKDVYMSEYTFTEEFFKDSSLAFIYVMLPNENYYPNVISQEENGNTLEIEYSTELDGNTDDRYEVVKYRILAAEISKGITKVKATEKSFKNIYRSFYTYKFNLPAEVCVVSDYDAWVQIYSSSNSGYLQKYDEEYFENGSLVLISGMMPDTSAYFDVIKMNENGESFEIVYGINSLGGLSVIEYKTLIIEVSKNIKSVSAERKDRDYRNNVYGGYVSEEVEGDPAAVVIKDYSELKKYAPESMKNSEEYTPQYFKDKSLVLVGVVTGSSAEAPIVRYAYEEEGTVNIGVMMHNYDTVGFTLIGYKTLVFEVGKDVTAVNAEIFE